jgi:hypothetical protein
MVSPPSSVSAIERVRASTKWWLLALGAAAVLYLLSRTQPGQSAVASVANYFGDLLSTRGIRDNNPGNVERTATRWQGELSQAEVAASGATWDAQFCQMDTPANGVRMIGHILRSYEARGLNTPRQLASTYSKTDQAAYVQNMADAIGVQPDDPIDVYAFLPALAQVIIQQENGSQPYAPADVAVWVYS